MFRVSIVISLFLSWIAAAQGHTVVFSAPAELRAAVAAELTAQSRVPLDLSELDEALYGRDGAKVRVASGRPVTLPAALPKEVRADFAKGLSGCRARAKPAQESCAEHLVGAVWERHLDRLHPERVIEIKTEADLVQLATYQPGDATIAGMMDRPATPQELKDLVLDALRGHLPALGSRPSTRVLPGVTPPVAAKLTQGAPQSLNALAVPKGCSLPKELVIEPSNAPLAVTIGTLWSATAAGQVQPDAKPNRCSLELTEESLAFNCGSEVATARLFAGSTFGEASFQAALARLFVEGEVRARCSHSR